MVDKSLTFVPISADQPPDSRNFGGPRRPAGEPSPNQETDYHDLLTSAGIDTLAVAGKIIERRRQLKKRFARLVADWKDQRNPYESNPANNVLCEPYQKIIAIGPEAIPLILGELRRNPDHWFWALRMLTDQNPVPARHKARFKEMVNDWLTWGAKNGFLSHS